MLIRAQDFATALNWNIRTFNRARVRGVVPPPTDKTPMGFNRWEAGVAAAFVRARGKKPPREWEARATTRAA